MVPPGSEACWGVFSLTSGGGEGFGCEGVWEAFVVRLGFAGLGFAGLGLGFEVGFGRAVLVGVGGAPSRKRSSSTQAAVGCRRHSSIAPSRTGVAWRSSTGGGAAPAAAKASGD